jgi:hypothetical protein
LSAPLIADLCCGIGGDLLALAERSNVVAVDNDPVANCFAAANLGAVLPNAEVRFHETDVADVELDGVAAWHIDPDRRATGRRTTSLDACRPNRTVIDRLLQRVPHAAIKLAPATKVPAAWTERCELEWISRGGECRQQVAWHGNLAHEPGQHRATILSAAGSIEAARSVVGKPGNTMRLASRLDQYVFDVDPAVLAARLQGALAAEHDLGALAHGPTYLTGSGPIDDLALTCFRVEDVLPLRVKSLAAHLREHGIGQLEIKKRGLEISPEQLRRELKLRGSGTATLLLTPIAGRASAILAQRIVR